MKPMMHSDFQTKIFEPRDDDLELLRELRKKGYKLGLISNCSIEAPDIWKRSVLAEFVDVAVFSTIERKRKPASRIFQMCAARLGVNPSQCIFVGNDIDTDFHGSRNAGMRGIWLSDGAELGDVSPNDKIIHLGEVRRFTYVDWSIP